MNITITTTTEFLQQLENTLDMYERALDNILYSYLPTQETIERRNEINTIRAEMNRLIGQAERQITQPDHSGVY